MKNDLEEFTAVANVLFPDQVKVFEIENIDSIKVDTALLFQHFTTPLTEVEQQELANQIARFLINEKKGTVYTYFWANGKTRPTEEKWFYSAAKLKLNAEEGIHQIVVFTYDLELMGSSKEKLFSVLKNLDFLKKNYAKASLLTKREIEIISLLAEGKTSIEVGKMLYISDHTVNTHRKNIIKKLNIKTFVDLIKFAAIFDKPTNKIKLYEN